MKRVMFVCKENSARNVWRKLFSDISKDAAGGSDH
jgi:hypothetical protein